MITFDQMTVITTRKINRERCLFDEAQRSVLDEVYFTLKTYWVYETAPMRLFELVKGSIDERDMVIDDDANQSNFYICLII